MSGEYSVPPNKHNRVVKLLSINGKKKTVIIIVIQQCFRYWQQKEARPGVCRWSALRRNIINFERNNKSSEVLS